MSCAGCGGILTRRRRGGAPAYFVVGLLIAAVAVGGLAWYLIAGSSGDDTLIPLMAEVGRGPYEHIVLEQGEVESSNNVEIRCEIRSRSGGGGSIGPSTSIIDVIAEGERVEAGDWLVTFDSSTLEQEANRQKIAVNTAEAIMIQAKAVYDTAVIARDEYLKGTVLRATQSDRERDLCGRRKLEEGAAFARLDQTSGVARDAQRAAT